MTKRRSNWYIYLITFLITGVLLYIVSNAMLSAFNEKKQNVTSEEQYSGTVFKPNASHNFTVLAMLSETADDIPDYYMTLTYRGDKNCIIVMPYLSDTSFGGETMKNAYVSGGAESVMKIINDALGTDITKYVKFTGSTVTEFFNMVGNTTLSVPREYKYEDKEDKSFSIVYAGTYSFTGNQMYNYLTFPDFGEADKRHPAKVHAVVYSSFINQNFFRVSESAMAGYFEYIAYYTDSNISEEDYESKKEAILYTFNHVNECCDYYIPFGDASGDSYLIAEQSIATAKDKLFGVD